MNYVFKILGSRWNLAIIWNLKGSSLRFTELKKRMGNVNSRTITIHLRDLEKYNIISRVVYAEVPPRVEYSLTEYGKAFLPICETIQEWGMSLPDPQHK